MYVTKIEPVTKGKYKIYIDGVFAFVLYKGEVKRYHLVEDDEIEEQVVETIRCEVILKRAKLRAMHLLTDMDRTEAQLRTKLLQNFYPEDIVDQAISYVKSFGYVEDAGYAKRFVSGKKMQKSKKELYAALSQKGVSRELIEQAIEAEVGEDGEKEAIRRWMEKKRFCADTADFDEKRKMYAFLLRKGFRYEDIRQVIQISECDT